MLVNRKYTLLYATGIYILFLLPYQCFADDTSLFDSIQVTLNLANEDPEYAEFKVNQMLSCIDTSEHKSEMAELLRIKGLISYYRTNYSEALSYFIRSKQKYIEASDTIGEAKALNNIAIVYSSQNLYELSLKLQLEILSLRISCNDSLNMAGSYNNIGLDYNNLNDHEKALFYYQKAIDSEKKYGDLKTLTMYLYNVGNLYMDQNEMDSAYLYFQLSLKNGLHDGDIQYLSNIYTYLGDYYLRIKEYSKAVSNLEKGFVYAKKSGVVYDIQSTANLLQKAYAAKNDFKNAYNTLALYTQIKDSSDQKALLKQLASIEYESELNKKMAINQIALEKKEIETQLYIRKQHEQRNIAIFTVFFITFIAFILYRAYKRKAEAHLILEQQNEEILAQKEETETQRDKIKELNHTKDKFMAIIAHDLRNPLAGITQLSDIMKRDFKEMELDKIQLYVSQINQASVQTSNLLDNLLQWAMVQVGKMYPQPEIININDIIHENIELYKTNIQQKNQLVLEKFNDNPMVYADRQMTTTVVRNLINNALKFTPNDGHIIISTKQVGEMMQITVKDNGIGIQKDDIPLLFNPSVNKKQIGTSKEKGNGLGLLLCIEFVHRNCGEIWAESIFGEGSKFIFTLPVIHEN